MSLNPTQPGGTWSDAFIVTDSSGAPAAPDATPVAVLYVNKAPVSTAVTVTQAVDNAAGTISGSANGNITGSYFLSATLTGRSNSDVVRALVKYTISSVSYLRWSDSVRLVQWGATALSASAAGAEGGVGDVQKWGGFGVSSAGSGVPVVAVGYVYDPNFGMLWHTSINPNMAIEFYDSSNELTYSIPQISLGSSGKVEASIATGDDADAAAVKAMIRGPGADTCTMTITNSETTLPIADADVWISTDSAGANVVAGTKQTNSQGKVTFLLDAGTTYYLWMQKDGENPILGQSFPATAD